MTDPIDTTIDLSGNPVEYFLPRLVRASSRLDDAQVGLAIHAYSQLYVAGNNALAQQIPDMYTHINPEDFECALHAEFAKLSQRKPTGE